MLCSFAEKLEADLATETCLASGQGPVKAAEQAVVAGRGSSLLPRTIGQKTNGMLQQALTLCSPLLSTVSLSLATFQFHPCFRNLQQQGRAR